MTKISRRDSLGEEAGAGETGDTDEAAIVQGVPGASPEYWGYF